MSFRVRPAFRAGIVASFALVGLAVAPALAAPLLPNDSQWKNDPSISGDPDYVSGLPSYFDAAHLVVPALVSTHNTSLDLKGVTTSYVYENPVTHTLTFAYVTQAAGTNTNPTVKATLGGNWVGVDITSTGADTSGSSTKVGTSGWTTGDPSLIYRADEDGNSAPGWEWRVSINNVRYGTTLAKGDRSAVIWFETNVPVGSTIDTAKIAFQDSGQIGQADILVPTPDPATLALMGLGAMFCIRRRREA